MVSRALSFLAENEEEMTVMDRFASMRTFAGECAKDAH
jgi:hypothetical protein